ncbi:MAG: hypothetical protein ABH883_07375 [Candidatus Omnitrophota bacterium]
MKILMIISILITLLKPLFSMPTAVLPEYPVHGTVNMDKREATQPMPDELRYMSRKMYYLKTGRIIENEINTKKQENFWGEGKRANVSYPSHLAEWESVRRTGNLHKIAIS